MPPIVVINIIPNINIIEYQLSICPDNSIISKKIIDEYGKLVIRPEINPLKFNNFVPINPQKNPPMITDVIKYIPVNLDKFCECDRIKEKI